IEIINNSLCYILVPNMIVFKSNVNIFNDYYRIHIDLDLFRDKIICKEEKEIDYFTDQYPIPLQNKILYRHLEGPKITPKQILNKLCEKPIKNISYIFSSELINKHITTCGDKLYVKHGSKTIRIYNKCNIKVII